MAIDPREVELDQPEIDPGQVTDVAAPSGLARRVIGDTAVSLAKGVIGAGEAAVGIADIPTMGAVGKGLSAVGYDPKVTREVLDEYLSPEQRIANQKVQQAKGFVPTVVEAVKNPSVIAHTAVESLPSILGGGAVARGARALTGMGPIKAAALGEGAVSAGSTAEQVRQESGDGFLTPGQAGISVASGAATAGLTALGGRIAKALGITDIETALAGQAATGAKKSLQRRVAEGFFSEGVLEELPQSAQEQIAQNIATGKPWHEGVENAAATGMLAGGLIGGAVNIPGARHEPPPPAAPPAPAGLLPAPGQVIIPMGGQRPAGPDLEGEAADMHAGAIYAARDAYEREQAALRASQEPPDGGGGPPALPAPGQTSVPQIPGDAGPFSVTQQHIANDAQDHANAVEADREREAQRLEASGPIGAAAAAAIRGGSAQAASAARQEEARPQSERGALALPEPVSEAEKRVAARVTEMASQLPAGSLQEAQKAAQDLSSRIPLTVVPHPAGQGYTLVPTSVLPDAWRERYAGIQRDGSLPTPASPKTEFTVSPSGTVTPTPETEQPSGMRATMADWRRDMGMPAPRGAEPTRVPQPIPQQLPITDQKVAQRRAEERTASTGQEWEVVPHPFMRKAFAIRPIADVSKNQGKTDTSAERVQESGSYTNRVQTPEVDNALTPDALDAAAHEAATSPQNDLAHPTAGQSKAGNYRKGHVKVNGLDVSIENPRGSVRVAKDGSWASTMPHHYGYIRRSEGADGDHVDTFIGPNPESTKVFVVDQIDPKTGKFDEHKVMLGFDTRQQAEAAYRSAYPKGWRGMGAVSATDVDGLKSWLKDGDTKRAFSPEQSKAQPRLTGKDLDGIVIREPVQVEETGETVYIERDAREALVESRSRVRKMEALLKCLKA